MTEDERRIILKKAKKVRIKLIEWLEERGGGHFGACFSIVDILAVMFFYLPNFHPNSFILSKGHAWGALFSTLLVRFEKDIELKKAFYKKGVQNHHPSNNNKYIKFTTGSLGHGISLGVGMALARMNNPEKLMEQVYVLCGDGELNEGSCWEALMNANKHKLSNFNLLIDRNRYQNSGYTELINPLEPLKNKINAFGLKVIECDGHSIKKLVTAFNKINMSKNKPKAIICNTIKGKGLGEFEEEPGWHYKRNISKKIFKKIRIAINENAK